MKNKKRYVRVLVLLHPGKTKDYDIYLTDYAQIYRLLFYVASTIGENQLKAFDALWEEERNLPAYVPLFRIPRKALKTDLEMTNKQLELLDSMGGRLEIKVTTKQIMDLFWSTFGVDVESLRQYFP